MIKLLCGDATAVLRQIPSDTAQCCVTSPPYWGQRDYDADGQIGLETTPSEYVAKLVSVFKGVRRVLKPDGVLWEHWRLLCDRCRSGRTVSRRGATGGIVETPRRHDLAEPDADRRTQT